MRMLRKACRQRTRPAKPRLHSQLPIKAKICRTNEKN